MEKKWQKAFSLEERPTLEDMKEFAEATYFKKILDYLTEEYQPKLSVEYSKEKGSFGGWHLKTKKYGGNIGTIYLCDGYVRMMVVVSELFEEELSENIFSMSEEVQKTFKESKPVMGGYWFVVDVISEKTLEDLKYLVTLRVRKLKKT
ncbi:MULTISPECIES: DUF3788 family protein [Enterococcus]|uniref:DUF3788 family protein n=1 Tax=Candidatus Enterococcus murrayae TaxID=2815321 RepID=A0ABS3HL01_9ENTE|nr:DUF3788 family protein [Enterococcus sp. MJM16]MBO0454121.1 DUF3788 family protein [Enterococcus sp. MJM16]